MATYNGTIRQAPRYEDGNEYTAVGIFSLPGALANADTITFAGMIPPGAQVLEVTVNGVEVDTNATPTGTINVGDGTTANAFIASGSIGLSAAGATQLVLLGNGANIATNAGRYKVLTNVVITVATAIATSATTGDLFVKVRYYCAGING